MKMLKRSAATAALLCLTALPSTTRERNHPLHEAVREGDLQRLVGLLQSGHNPNDVDAYGKTALHYAVSGPRDSGYPYVSELLRFGADADARDTMGFAPLHNAAINGAAAVANLLVDAGADVNAKTDSDGTGSALAFAYLNGHMDLADMFEHQGAAIADSAKKRKLQIVGHITAAARRVKRSMQGLSDKDKIRAFHRELRKVREKYGYHSELSDEVIARIAKEEFASEEKQAQAAVAQ